MSDYEWFAKERGIDLSKTTLPPLWWPLFFCEDPRLHRTKEERGGTDRRCAVCGAFRPLNEHHIVPLARGKVFDLQGDEMEPPTISLCGFGNHGRGSMGYPYCHGLAHNDRLHFRVARTFDDFYAMDELEEEKRYRLVSDRLEFLITDKPVKYQTALMLEGWRAL